jgi:hypothetical protein
LISPSPRGLDRQEDHVLVAVDDGRLGAVGLGAGHAAERLEAQDHVRVVLVRVVDVLGDLEVALAALGARVVERVGQRLHLVHVDDVVGGAAERVDHAAVLAAEDLSATVAIARFLRYVASSGGPLATSYHLGSSPFSIRSLRSRALILVCHSM